jgi:hypothetical protein
MIWQNRPVVKLRPVDATNLPILVAGGGAGIVRGGCHRRYADTPLANLHLTILDNLGLRRDSLGDSNGELPLLS